MNDLQYSNPIVYPTQNERIRWLFSEAAGGVVVKLRFRTISGKWVTAASRLFSYEKLMEMNPDQIYNCLMEERRIDRSRRRCAKSSTTKN